ncbi:MAG: 3'-5' exonuclease, partial [SAR202 cluster bacterium]|nr:3'-5' exonuclease [SAR202 cluster bacterium]
MVLVSGDVALSPLRQTMVALDLETTGLDFQHDAIIEVGALKFRGRTVLQEFSTFVNPYRPIPSLVQKLTGITPQDVAAAPSFSTVAAELESFVGDLPVVGHNVRFDLSFLSRGGLRFSGPPFDTQDLASVLKAKGEYSLAALTREMGIVNRR